DIAAKGDVRPYGVMVRPTDGKIVVGGSATSQGGMLAARLNPDGTLDTTFGPNGQGWVATASGSAGCMGTDASGDILLGGKDTSNNVPAIVRLTPGGLPDASFGIGGEKVIAVPGTPNSPAWGIGVQSTGKIVFSSMVTPAGSSYGYAFLGRLNA